MTSSSQLKCPHMFLTRPEVVVVFSSDRYKIFFSNMKAPSAACWNCSVVQVSVLLLDFILSPSASLAQSSIVPASGCKIQTNSGPYKPILNNYNWNICRVRALSAGFDVRFNIVVKQITDRKIHKNVQNPKYSWARDNVIDKLINF